MPSEFRRIVFGNAELRQAIDSYDKASLPPGRLLSVKFRDAAHDHLVLTLQQEGGKTEAVVLATSIVAVSLIRYCISSHVPLPRGAQKALTMSGDNVALELQTGSKVVEVPPSQTADLKRPSAP
jgi:hypothetical protein